jgi:hypothetical protein
MTMKSSAGDGLPDGSVRFYPISVPGILGHDSHDHLGFPEILWLKSNDQF